jgi:hypothetical protein
VRWALAGALAAGRYRAEPRFTTDADFLVMPSDLVAAEFEHQGYEVLRTVEDGEAWLLRIRGKGNRIDVIFATMDYQELALERAKDNVLTIEDVVIHKLIAWRPRDRDDIDSILTKGDPYDDAYIRHWATEWDVLDRWEQALRR